MTFCIRILAGLTFLLSAAVLLLGLAGGIGVWVVKEPVTAKATLVFGRIDAALGVAEKSLDQVKASLAQAADRLDSARKEQRAIDKQSPKANVMRRTLARTVQRSVAPQLNDAHQKLHTVAEAAIVVNSILEDVGSFPFLATTGLDVDGLTAMNNSLAGVGPAAWELSRLLGEPAADADAEGAQMSRIERALQSIQGLVAAYEPRLAEVRQRTDALKAKTLPWITPAAVVISGLCFWIALAQVSLMTHACSWWRYA
jgi:hypothetical protein